MSVLIHSSTSVDTPALVECLVRSFDDDPIVNWFVRQDERRDEAFRGYFRLILEHLTLPFGEVYHSENHTGTALWTPPGKWNIGIGAQMQMFPGILRSVGFKSLARVLGGFHAMELAHPKRPHMYLLFLCASPEERGKGIGGALLRHTLQRCDAEGLPAYLENTKPENEEFYKKHGFECVGNIQLGRGAPDYFASMIREPTSGS